MPRLVADDNATLLRAGLAGLGIAVLPLYIAREALEKGSLVRLLDAYVPSETWFRIYVPRRKQHIARIEALVAFLSSRMHGEGWLEDVRLPL